MEKARSITTQDHDLKKVDPVMMQVVKNGLDSIAEQMAITLQYTAHSPVFASESLKSVHPAHYSPANCS